MIIRKIVALTVFLILASRGLSAAPPFKIEETTLKNGMKVVTAPDSSAPVITVQIFADASERYEHKGITGISHISEHCFFLGSKKVPPKQFSRIIDGWGGSENAYTGNDYTSYWASVPKEKLDKLVEMYADMILNKTFSKEYFDNEMKVIQEERRLTDNNPDRIAYLDFMELLFAGKSYGRPVIGYWDDLKKISLEDLKRYWQEFYAVNNLVAVVAGDVTHNEVVSSFKKWFGDAKSRKIDKPSELYFKADGKERREVIEREGAANPLILIGYPAVTADDPDFTPLDMLSSILSSGATSRFRKDIILDRKLAQSASSYVMMSKEKGAFVVYAEPMAGISASELERALYEEIERIKSEGPSAWDLERVVNDETTNFVSGFQSTSRKADIVGASYILSKKKFGYYDDYLERLKRVTPEDIKRVASKYLVKENRSVFVQLPKGGSYYGTKLSDVKVQDFKNAKRIEFKNGLVLYYLFADEVPVVSISLSMGGGSAFDPKGKEGTASLAADMIGKGTKGKSEDELDRILDLNSINFSASAGRESLDLDMSFLKDKTEVAFDYLADLLQNTVVDGKILEREKNIQLSAIESNRTNPRAAAMSVFEKIVFGGRGIGNPNGGSLKSVRVIGPGDIEEYLQRYLTSKNTSITVVGDIDLEYLIDLIGYKLRDYPDKDVTVAYQSDTRPFKGLSYVVVDMPWLSQAFIYIDGPGITRKDPAYNSARVMNYILGGGGFSSRLVDVLRGEMGLAYSARSNFSLYRNVGTFGFSIQTKIESTRKAIDGFFAQLDKFYREGPTAGEFDAAKSYYLGNLPFQTETVPKKVVAISSGVYYGAGPDMIFNDYEKIKKLTMDDVRGQIKRLLGSKDYLITIIGKKEEIEKQLGPQVKIRQMKIEDLF